MSDADLLPPNATDQERAMAHTIARISDVPTPQRDLWSASACPLSLLPWLSWALHVDSWNTDWTEAQKRAVIAASVDLHRHKGTVGSVKRALAPFGLSSAIQEWWQQTPQGAPHTFKILLAFITTPESVQDSIIDSVRKVKPVRSDMSVELTLGFVAQINTVGIGQCTVYRRLEATAQNVIPLSLNVNALGYARAGTFVRLNATAN